MKRTFALVSAAAAAALIMASPSWAQQSDAVVSDARASGLIGEQADGFLGYAPGAQISADLRGRVGQINIQRRSLYTQRATELSVPVNEMAAAVACEIFKANPAAANRRIAIGERYRDEAGQWRQRTSQDIAVPSFCPE